MSNPKSQFRLEQITASLPQSNESYLTTSPSHGNLADTLKSLASSVRRLNSWDESGVNFYADAQVFKAMGAENRFVLLDNQQLFVSSSTFLSGNTTISTKDTGALSVTGSNAASFDLGSKLNATGSGIDLLARTGNINIESKTGTSFIENGTEVFSINTSRQARFHQNAGTLAAPDVEFDGKVRFDELIATSGSSMIFTRGGDQIIGKNNSGDLTLSGASGDLNFIDTFAKSSTWSDKDKGIPLSTSASDWSALVSAGITSIIGGLGTTLTSDKYIGKLTADLAAGSATSLNMDFTYVSDPQIAKRVDVFLNGVLLNSGSATDVTNGTCDYTIDKSGGVADVEVKFSMDLETDDIITVTIR